jgi:DNA-binding NarL/FixJ family response regulator
MAIRILIAEGHRMMRDGLASILRQAGGFDVVAETSEAEETFRAFQAWRPDVVLLSMGLKGVSAADMVGFLVRCNAEARILLLAADEPRHKLNEALSAGALGLLSQAATENDLLEAIGVVARGSSYIYTPPLPSSDRHVVPLPKASIEQLSPREHDVLRLVADGKSSKEIANLLSLEVETVRSYRKTMMKKLGASNAATVTLAAVAAGVMGAGRPSTRAAGRPRATERNDS